MLSYTARIVLAGYVKRQPTIWQYLKRGGAEKMARTKAYNKSVYMQVKNINRRLLNIERLLGMDSEQYRRYVNTITAALPPNTFNLDPATGRIRIKTAKPALESLKLGQLRSTLKNPTAKESIKAAKASIKRTKAARAKAAGDESAEKITISDMEALEELKAKQILEEYKDENGKLRYDESVTADMQQKGAKTYAELAAILTRGKENANAREEGEAQAAQENDKKEQRRAYNRAYYQKNKERINERRRATRSNQRAGKG